VTFSSIAKSSERASGKSWVGNNILSTG
jgi:hypothetical protein